MTKLVNSLLIMITLVSVDVDAQSLEKLTLKIPLF